MYTTLTTQMALGAAQLRSQGESIPCFLPLRDRTRSCFIESVEDADAERVHLLCRSCGIDKRALVATGKVLVSNYVADRLLETYARVASLPIGGC